jgi:hypothetical protein
MGLLRRQDRRLAFLDRIGLTKPNEHEISVKHSFGAKVSIRLEQSVFI